MTKREIELFRAFFRQPVPPGNNKKEWRRLSSIADRVLDEMEKEEMARQRAGEATKGHFDPETGR